MLDRLDIVYLSGIAQMIKEILNMVKGVNIDFCETEIPSQESVVQIYFSQEQPKADDTEVQVLLQKV